ncbi:MAG: glycosyltransferase family 4 protein [Saezia sp.]
MTEHSPLRRPLSIVMIAHSHLLGGMERHVVALSKSMVEYGHQVVFAGPMDGWLGEQMRKAGFTCCDIAFSGMYDVVSWAKLVRFARKHKADVLHGHSQRGARYAAWGAWSLGLAAVATAHSTDSHKWFKSSVHVIAVAEAVKRFLLTQGLADDHVHVVHSGVNDVPTVRWLDLHEISSERPLKMGMIARVEHLKGHDIALNAMLSLKDKVPTELLIVGDDSTQWGRALKERVHHIGIADQVQFLGQRDDIAEVIASLDVVLAPSRREALGLALIEAAASARPAIAADVGGTSEVVLHEKTGILFPCEDVLAMAEAIERLCNPQLRVEYGKAARQYYEHEFTIEAMQQKTENVYRKAIAERKK